MYPYRVVVLQCAFTISFYTGRQFLSQLLNKVFYRVLLNIHMHILAGLGRYICRRQPKASMAHHLNVSCTNRKCGRLYFDIDNDLSGQLEIFLLYLSKFTRTMRLVYLICSSEVFQYRDHISYQTKMPERLCRKTIRVYR